MSGHEAPSRDPCCCTYTSWYCARWSAGVCLELLARDGVRPGSNTRRILAQIATGSGTEGIGISPDARYIYTSSVYINEIVRIDTSTLQVVGRAVMQNCLGAVRVVPTPTDGRTLIVNCADNGRVLVVDAETLRVRHNIVVGTLPIGITVPNDRFAYVANMLDDTISVIDISRGAVRRTIAVGDDPDGIVFVPN